MPDQLDQIPALAPEHKHMPAMRISFQDSLYQQRQSAEALAHIRLAARKPHPDTRRDRNHQFVSAATTCRKASGFTVPLTRSLMPPTSSISMLPAAGVTGADVEGEDRLPAQFTAGTDEARASRRDVAICTGTKPATTRDPLGSSVCRRLPVSPASLRQRNSKLLAMPYFRATADTGKCRVSSTA